MSVNSVAQELLDAAAAIDLSFYFSDTLLRSDAEQAAAEWLRERARLLADPAPLDAVAIERVAREGALRHSLRDKCSCGACREEYGPAGAPGRCGACPYMEHGDVCADSTAYEAILTAMGAMSTPLHATESSDD